ncbi:hypothetical protein ES703_18304 [subsurface metagenome]
MAKIVSGDQRLVTGATNPASVYSRVVSCSGVVTHTNPKAIYTVGVGERVRLLEVKLFWEPFAADNTAVTYFRVMTGTTTPATASEMNQAWENILPKLGEGHLDANWYHEYGITEMSWEMNQLFTGTGRRFGVWLQTVMPGKGQACQASFKISEG